MTDIFTKFAVPLARSNLSKTLTSRKVAFTRQKITLANVFPTFYEVYNVAYYAKYCRTLHVWLQYIIFVLKLSLFALNNQLAFATLINY